MHTDRARVMTGRWRKTRVFIILGIVEATKSNDFSSSSHTTPRASTTMATADVPSTHHTRTVAVLLGSAGGVSGAGSGARPSADATALVKWSLARGILNPHTDRLVAVHCVELSPLVTSCARVVTEPVTENTHPEWMPLSLVSAFKEFTANEGGKGASALRLETSLPQKEALVKFLSGDLFGNVTGTFQNSPSNDWNLTGAPPPGAVDLVLVGTRDNLGTGDAIKRFVLGSVSRFVLESNPVPVCVVRQRDARKAQGFGNDHSFVKRGKNSVTSLQSPHHTRASSFPGNWHLGVDEKEDDDDGEDTKDTSFVPDLSNLSLQSDTATIRSDPFALPRTTQLAHPKVTGNVVCVSHDGGPDGVALVRWALRNIVRPDDRAIIIAHVTSSESLSDEFSGPSSIVSQLLQLSDDDVTHAFAKFRNLEPTPATTPASSVVVVGTGDSTANTLGPFLPPGSSDAISNKWGLGALLKISEERGADLLIVGSRGKERKTTLRRKDTPHVSALDIPPLDETQNVAPLLRSNVSSSSIASNVSSASDVVGEVGGQRGGKRRGAGGAARTCARLAPCAVLAVPSHAMDAFRPE